MDSEADQPGKQITEQATHLDAIMHRFLADLREFDERGGWPREGRNVVCPLVRLAGWSRSHGDEPNGWSTRP